MIHYAFQFCQSVEDSQGVNENLLQATDRVANSISFDLLLKTRDSLRELATRLEHSAVQRQNRPDRI